VGKPGRILAAWPAAVVAVALCGVAPPANDATTYAETEATTFVETTATATAHVPPDRLFIAIDVEAEADAPNVVGDADLDAAVKRLEQHGIAAASIVKRYVTTADPRWRRVTTDLDQRPYGIVLLVIARPGPGALVALTERTLTAAFEKPLSDGTFAEVGGAWYGLDDCRRLRLAARKGSIALARERGEHVAQAAGFTLDVPGGVRAAESGVDDAGHDEGGQSYVCGRNALPDVPPPQIREPEPEAERNGFVEEESTITVGWPTLPLGNPRPIALPKNLTSLGWDGDPGDTRSAPLQPGTLRALGAVSSADVAGGGCAFDRAVSGAIALAQQRAAIAGRSVGLVPDHPLTIVDETEYRTTCPARGPAEPPETARIGETFAAAGEPNRFRTPAHLEASGTTELRVPADRARFVATLKTDADWDATVRQLSSAGVDPATLHARAGATPTIEGFVPHPTAATMQALDVALASLSAPGTTPARTVAYAVDDCSALNERVLRGATEAARNAARTEAGRRGVRLRAVTAVDAGPVVIRNCGPRVLERLALEPPGAPAPGAAVDPTVTANGTVRLLFSL
jgi:uncharacterized protein YggE